MDEDESKALTSMRLQRDGPQLQEPLESVFRKMALMRDAGLTPLQILRSVTTNGARAMARSDLGAVAPGKLANVVVLDADPPADVANLSRAERLIKAGVVYDPRAMIDSIR